MHDERSRIVLCLALGLLPIILSGCPSPSHQPPDQPTTYVLTVASSPGGTTTPAGALNVEPGAATQIKGNTGVGCSWGNWTVTSGTASISDVTSISTTVTLSSGDATVQANFPPLAGFYILTIIATAGGSTNPAGAQVVHDGDATAISVLAYVGYKFLNWTVTSGLATIADPNSGSTTVSLKGNATIQANFGQ